MKKIFLATLLLVITVAVIAQTSSPETKPAATIYNVPQYIKINYETTYPGIPASIWEPLDGVWRVTFKNNNRINQVYFTPNGDHYKVVIPVVINNVPESIITAAIDKYGASLYDIMKLKDAATNDVYKIRTKDKGALTTVWMDDKGMETTVSIKTNEETKINVPMNN